ncbi:hypothetical protein Scep_006735 [Stephania cephalantha]|uniref:Uncharacterized protein n=1 Tax=Stephania cephalantha TaxID=152367 RepID=A0AAP0KA82_9MAGN
MENCPLTVESSEKEAEELLLEVGESNDKPKKLKFCLIGRFHTDKSIHFDSMKNQKSDGQISGTRNCLTVVECPSSRYIFQFDHSFG